MKRVATLLLVAAALSGCAAATDPADDQGRLFDEYDVPMNDGTTVTCLTYDRALDCDWSKR